MIQRTPIKNKSSHEVDDWNKYLVPYNGEQPRKTLIYGHGGVGKSTFAGKFPEAIFWVSDPGLTTLKVQKIPRAYKYDDFIRWTDFFEKNLQRFDTLVLDSLSTLEQLIWEKVCSCYRGKDGRIQRLNNINDAGYGAGYVQAMEYWEQIFKFLDRINEKGKEIILLSHARADISVNTETQDSLKMMPAVYKHVQNKLDQWCDEIFYAYTPMFLREETNAGKTTMKGTKSQQPRMMACSPCGCWMAKNRLDFPLEIEFDYDVYCEHRNKFFKSF
jgi:GTPase SAR1 family protein